MKITLLKQILTSAVAHIGHELVEWKLVEGNVDVIHAKTRDKWGTWSWAIAPDDKHGHMRFDISACSVSYKVTTRLATSLYWSDLGVAMKEACTILVKQRLLSDEYKAARAAGGVDKQLRPVDRSKVEEAAPEAPTPTPQPSLF